MLKKRKGAIEIQFSWIFILVAGAVILAFFFSVVGKQREIAQQRLSITFVTDFEAITSGAAVAKGTAQFLPIFNQAIDFSCSEFCDCRFSVGEMSRPFGDKLIFSPKQIQGREILLWALEWKSPFRVTNFLFITDDRTHYWLVGAESMPKFKTYLEEKLPDKLKADRFEFVDAAQLADKGFAKNRIIFFDATKYTSTIADDFNKVSAIVVSVLDSSISFYDKIKTDMRESRTSTYYSNEQLLAAIFAEDVNEYECGIKDAYGKLENIATIYSERADKLAGVEEYQNRDCNKFYAGMISPLDTIETGANLRSKNLQDATAAIPASTVEKLNRELMLSSCPTLY